MTMTQAVLIVRDLVGDNERIRAIRFLRRLGLSFPTARTMVDEIAADAPWYRSY